MEDTYGNCVLISQQPKEGIYVLQDKEKGAKWVHVKTNPIKT